MDKELLETARAFSLMMAVPTFLLFYVATQAPPINYYWMLLPLALFAPGIWSRQRAMRILAIVGLSTSCLLMLIGAFQVLAG